VKHIEYIRFYITSKFQLFGHAADVNIHQFDEPRYYSIMPDISATLFNRPGLETISIFALQDQSTFDLGFAA
jgi:hypothetical protein